MGYGGYKDTYTFGEDRELSKVLRSCGCSGSLPELRIYEGEDLHLMVDVTCMGCGLGFIHDSGARYIGLKNVSEIIEDVVLKWNEKCCYNEGFNDGLKKQ